VGVHQKTTVFYPIYYADDEIFRPLWDHLLVTKIYMEEKYTEYDHNIGAYCKLLTKSPCGLDYTY